MDTKQFIASLVGSLAWPVAVVVVVLLFREQLAKLLSGPLKRLKAGPSGLELEFDRVISEAQAQVEPVPALEPPSESLTAELGDIARLSPAAAVMDGYARIEEALRERLRDAQDAHGYDLRRSPVVLARIALEKGLITPETAEAVQGAATLRNLAAHGSAADVSEDRAREYLALVDAILFAIRQPVGLRSPRGRLEAYAKRGNELLARIDQAMAKGYTGSLTPDSTIQIELQRLAGDMTRWLATAEELVKRWAPRLLDEYHRDYGQGEPAAAGAPFYQMWEPLRQRVDALQRVIDAMEDEDR